MSGALDPDRGFDTPEEAALWAFDPRYARIVAIRWFDEDRGEVELATNEPPHEYPYFVQVARRDRRWHEGGSSNGSSFGVFLNIPS